MKKVMTLVLVHQDSMVLLGMKKRGFGEGRWNGFGGKVESGESIENAAKRELQEEAGITVDSLEKHAILTFTFDHNDDEIEAHIFKAQDFDGEITESEEMRPVWFMVEDIPYTDMWKSDALWLPLFLEGKQFGGHFHFDESHAILKYTLKEITE